MNKPLLSCLASLACLLPTAAQEEPRPEGEKVALRVQHVAESEQRRKRIARFIHRRKRGETQNDETVVAELWYSDKVTAVDANGWGSLERELTRARVKRTTAGGSESSFDSAEPLPTDKGARELHGIYGAAVGRTALLEVDTAGTCVVYDGSALGAAGEALLESDGFPLPTRRIAVGGSWGVRKELTVPDLGRLVLRGTGTLRAIEQREGRGVALLRAEGEIVREGKWRVPVELSDATFEVNVELDLDAGAVLKTTTRLKLTMTPTAKPAVGEPESIQLIADELDRPQ